jgi:SulP family sulfate permease
VTSFFPALKAFKGYDRRFLSGDVNAGITVGVMLIPQGMAYAMIAGMPPIYGLYASLVPLLVYAFMGTSAQLAVGPVAMVSLLVATGVGALADQGTDAYITLAILLAFLVGVFQLALGLARFGFLTAFLSHPVLSGFTSAAALMIGYSQVGHLQVNTTAALVGAAGIVLLVAFRMVKRRLPGALIVVALGTAATWYFNFDVPIVGTVPAGLPMPSFTTPSVDQVTALLPTVLAIGLVGFMESIAVAKSLAAKHGDRINSSQELVALGASNIVGALFQSFPVTGGFSRSAVNDQAGARTTLASLISAGVVGLTLLFLTPLFTHLPKALLASIVLVAVYPLVNWRDALHLWKTSKPDLALLVVTFAATLILGIEEGILVGVVLSILMVVQQASRPHVARLGCLPGTTTYKNRQRWPAAVEPDGIAILRVDASLFFANVDFLWDTVMELLDKRPDARVILIDMYPVNRMDASAVHGLETLLEELSDRNIALFLSGVKGPVLDIMDRSGLLDHVGRDRMALEIHDAVEAAQRYLSG